MKSSYRDGTEKLEGRSFLYGGTYNEFKVTFKKFGIGVNWVTEDDPAAFAKAIDEKTKAIYVETIANPGFTLSNIPALSKVRHHLFLPDPHYM